MDAVSRIGRWFRVPGILRLACLGVFVAGCGAESSEKNVMTDPTGQAASVPQPASAPPQFGPVDPPQNEQTAENSKAKVEGAAAKEAPAAPIPRKILYTADIELVTDDLAKLEATLTRLVRQCSGYIADTDITGSSGSTRSARWKIRIPVEKFDTFLESSVNLGELARRQVNSQDVTAEYYDLESRIKNKKVEETRLLKHLQDSTAKLEDILAAEKELSRVREEVERQEGRLRLLANLATLTTITIHASERITFVPTTAPNFTTKAGRRFWASVEAVKLFGEVLLLVAIMAVPWLPFVIVVGLVIFIARRLMRRSNFVRSQIVSPRTRWEP